VEREKILNNYRETARHPWYPSQRKRVDEKRVYSEVENEGVMVDGEKRAEKLL